MRECDPIGAWLRDTRAQRRVGRKACPCGEARPYAIISWRSRPICFRCERLAQGREPYEDDHPFGRHSGGLTIRIPINDHRAILSVAQYQWPPETLQNPEGDPFLASAARYRGLFNIISYILADCVKEAERFERLSAAMRERYGPRWWLEEAKAGGTSDKARRKRRRPPHR